MAFPGQKLIQGEGVRLEPLTGVPDTAHKMNQLIRANAADLDRQLPGLTAANITPKRTLKRHRLLHDQPDREGYAAISEETGRLFGAVTLLEMKPFKDEAASAQIDYWIFPDGSRYEAGLEIGRLAIARGFEIHDTAPHAWLYEVDDPSEELRHLMVLADDQSGSVPENMHANTGARTQLYQAKIL